jgi:hypothetical protein
VLREAIIRLQDDLLIGFFLDREPREERSAAGGLPAGADLFDLRFDGGELGLLFRSGSAILRSALGDDVG